LGQDGRKFAGVLPDDRSDLFFSEGLDRPKQPGITGEISFQAQAPDRNKINLDLRI